MQAACLAFLALDRRCVWAERINSGATVIGEGSKRRFIRFSFKGCPDIIGQLATGHFLAVECKAPTGRLSPEQKAFIDKVNRHGGLGVVAYSIEDLQEALDAYQ